MKYRLVRYDRQSDVHTDLVFDNYDQAYDFLFSISGDLCCSDADYFDGPYYEIVPLPQKDPNN